MFGTADAAMACGPHDELTKVLTEKYKEARKGRGLVGNLRLMEMFVSDKGTWSLVFTDRRGKSCIAAAGHTWEDDKGAIY